MDKVNLKSSNDQITLLPWEDFEKQGEIVSEEDFIWISPHSALAPNILSSSSDF